MHPTSSKTYYGARKPVGDVKTKWKKKKNRSKRRSTECILVLNKARGNAIAHYNESVFSKSHGVGHAVESEKAKNSGNGGAGKNSNIFFLSKFPLEEYLESWDFQISPEINKWCLLFLCVWNKLTEICVYLHSVCWEKMKLFFLVRLKKKMCWSSIYSSGTEKYKTVFMLSRFKQRNKEVSTLLLQAVPCVVKCTDFAVTLTWYKSKIYY